MTWTEFFVLLPVLIMLGLLLGVLAHRLSRWRIRRPREWWTESRQLPRGTRPTVLLVVDEVTYDMTDSLLDAGVRDDGNHVWVIQGPPHVRLDNCGGILVKVANPVPERTRLMLHVTGPRDNVRFETVDELTTRYPGLKADQPHSGEDR